MTTIDLECPHCGRVGHIPRDLARTGLLCRKCHKPFHMDAEGKVHVGEPRGELNGHAVHGGSTTREIADEDEGLDPEIRRRIRLALAGCLGVLLLILGGISLRNWMLGPWADAVTPHAQAVAEAFASDAEDVVRANATEETSTLAAKFFEEARPRLADMKRDAPGHDIKVNLLIYELNPENDQAKVMGTYTAERGTARDSQIAEASGTDLSARKPLSLMFHWERDSHGQWKLDGKKTAELNRLR